MFRYNFILPVVWNKPKQKFNRVQVFVRHKMPETVTSMSQTQQGAVTHVIQLSSPHFPALPVKPVFPNKPWSLQYVRDPTSIHWSLGAGAPGCTPGTQTWHWWSCTSTSPESSESAGRKKPFKQLLKNIYSCLQYPEKDQETQRTILFLWYDGPNAHRPLNLSPLPAQETGMTLKKITSTPAKTSTGIQIMINSGKMGFSRREMS